MDDDVSGPAGQSMAENLRLAGSRTPLILITREDIPPYDRVLLSKVRTVLLGRLLKRGKLTEYRAELRAAAH